MIQASSVVEGRIRLVENEPDVRACFSIVTQLRPHLTESVFLEQVRRQGSAHYRLAVLEQEGAVRAVAGFRVTETLFGGKTLYVDDLVTDETARSRGFGARLMAWLVEHARGAGCEVLELDSGVQRHQAHRFYFRQGLHISSFRFRMRLGEPGGGPDPRSLVASEDPR